ncbi:MAG: hypothetical protein FJW39_21990 [Acidobacteria bacterium]|nr:hypothetical protein [Acidobacteriota bacterium]
MKRVISVCTDLFFLVKIQDAARRAGVQLVSCTSLSAAVEATSAGAGMAVLDLNCRDLDAIEVARALKSDPRTAHVPQVGFLSHVQADRAAAARQAGCDRVVARSAFSSGVFEIFKEVAA